MMQKKEKNEKKTNTLEIDKDQPLKGKLQFKCMKNKVQELD